MSDLLEQPWSDFPVWLDEVLDVVESTVLSLEPGRRETTYLLALRKRMAAIQTAARLQPVREASEQLCRMLDAHLAAAVPVHGELVLALLSGVEACRAHSEPRLSRPGAPEG